MRAALTITAAPLAITALLAGCGGQSPDGAQSKATPIEASPPAHTRSGYTTVLGPFPDDKPCPRTSDSNVPAGSGCLSVGRGEFDGDGKPDRWLVYAYPLTSGGDPKAWHSRVLLASGTVLNGQIPNSQPARYLGAHRWFVGSTDANGDGEDDAFIRVDGGASTNLIRIYYVQGAEIRHVLGPPMAGFPGGEPLQLTVGGTAGVGSGARCEDVNRDGRPELLLTGYSYKPPHHWRWSERVYGWRGHTLSFLQTRHGNFHAERVNRTFVPGSSLHRFAVLRCDGVSAL